MKISKNKRYQVIVIIIVIIAFITIGYSERFPTVKNAISIGKAERRMEHNEDYYIVKTDLNTGLSYYKNSINGWEQMEYIGREPEMELSSVFTAANNRYLVKAKKIDVAGKTYLKIEEWDILFPIKRAYASEYENTRILYSKHKIDKFDVERGDYIKGLYNEEVVSIKNARETIEKEPKTYFVIVPKQKEQVEWYFSLDRGIPTKEEEVMDKVEVVGETPEKFLSEIFLKEEKKQRNGGIEHQRNLFLVKGNYDEKENILEIEEWNFVDRILRFYSAEEELELEKEKVFHTEFYLDEQDIKRGDYYPKGNKGASE